MRRLFLYVAMGSMLVVGAAAQSQQEVAKKLQKHVNNERTLASKTKGTQRQQHLDNAKVLQTHVNTLTTGIGF